MSRALCGLTSQLLRYPDSDFVASLPSIADAVGELPRSRARARQALASFVAHCRERDLHGLQEEYVQTFDFSPEVTLHLTAHTFGQEKDRSVTPQRGFALVQLAEVYAAHGVELEGGELPDFLPALLEFVSSQGCPPDLDRYMPALLRCVRLLSARLAERGSVYAPVMECAQAALASVRRAEGGRR